MLRALAIFAVLAAVVALPFALRPSRPSIGRPEDTLVIVTPHNEAIRREFARGFRAWYRARTGREVFLEWRVLGGGGGDIVRYLQGGYIGSFRNLWVGRMGRRWSSAVQAGFMDGSPSARGSAGGPRGAGGLPEVGCRVRHRPVLRRGRL